MIGLKVTFYPPPYSTEAYTQKTVEMASSAAPAALHRGTSVNDSVVRANSAIN